MSDETRHDIFWAMTKSLLIAGASIFLLVACAGLALRPTAEDWVPKGAPAIPRQIAAREPCVDHEPLRRAFFGDLHVHTGYSSDARSRDMRSTPDDAYRLARGEAIDLGPFDDEGRGARQARLERPLDFAAVTDHAEWLGEVTLCTQPGSPSFDTESCRWSWRECLAIPDAERPSTCSDPEIPRVIQERAWTSPIWYEPANTAWQSAQVSR